ELTRLAHHVEQAEKAARGGEAAGKKLDFLSQEMLREVNTMGSKSRSAALRTLVVELKTEVERIREQVQNVERSEEHTSELQSPYDLVCRLLLEKKKNKEQTENTH